MRSKLDRFPDRQVYSRIKYLGIDRLLVSLQILLHEIPYRNPTCHNNVILPHYPHHHSDITPSSPPPPHHNPLYTPPRYREPRARPQREVSPSNRARPSKDKIPQPQARAMTLKQARAAAQSPMRRTILPKSPPNASRNATTTTHGRGRSSKIDISTLDVP